MTVPAGFEQRAYVLTTVADPDAITVAELTAGTEVTGDLPAPWNFSATQNYIDVSDISDARDKQRTGTVSPDNLDFEVYRRSTGQVAIDALDDNTEYYLVKFEGSGIADLEAGPAAGDTYDVAFVLTGIKADVSSPRGESRRVAIRAALMDGPFTDLVLVA